MKKLISSLNQVETVVLKCLLNSHGISCFLKNDFLSGGVGELPPQEACLEIWIKDENDFIQAKAIIEDIKSKEKINSSPWSCDNCGESNPRNFELCWNCEV